LIIHKRKSERSYDRQCSRTKPRKAGEETIEEGVRAEIYPPDSGGRGSGTEWGDGTRAALGFLEPAKVKHKIDVGRTDHRACSKTYLKSAEEQRAGDQQNGEPNYRTRRGQRGTT